MTRRRYRRIAIRLLIELIMCGGKACPRRMYRAVARNFRLSKREWEELTEDGEERNRWEKHVRGARQHLKRKGFVVTRNGFWKVTPEGWRYARDWLRRWFRRFDF